MKTIETQLLGSLDEFIAFTRARVGDPELAADLVQDSLLKALKAADNVREHESARAWFYRILRHTIIDLYRQRATQKKMLERFEHEVNAPVTDDEEAVACGCLRKLMPALTPQYATVIERLDLKGESPESVAKHLGVTPNNLTVRLHRARKQLKERLVQTCKLCAKHGCVDCQCEPAAERKG